MITAVVQVRDDFDLDLMVGSGWTSTSFKIKHSDIPRFRDDSTVLDVVRWI
jgi:hypothetical protein